MATATPRRRASPRVEISVDVALSRAASRDPVTGRTLDVGPGGMLVETRRPLRLGEPLQFTCALQDGGDGQLTGRAHVVREHVKGVYGLCFERLGDAQRARLAALVAT
jgi:hypothetical protein